MSAVPGRSQPLLRPRRLGIPLADLGSFADEVRGSTVVRVALALLLGVVLLATVMFARNLEKPSNALLQPETSVVVVLDLSASIDASLYGKIAATLRELATSGRRLGLVVFSSDAYEALPPGTHSSALTPYLRFFSNRPDTSLLSNPWSFQFRGGTRITAGLQMARAILRRDHVENAGVLLVSDLVDNSADTERLTRTLLAYERDGIDLRIVPLSSAGNGRVFESILGKDVFVTRPEAPLGERGQRRTATIGSSPRWLLLAGALLLVVLALNEQWSARLTWRGHEGERT